MPSYAVFDDVVVARVGAASAGWTDNLVRNAAIGIGVSNDAVIGSDRSIVVSGNVVRACSVGGIVPSSFTGTTFNRVGTAEYGNVLATTAGSVTFGHNRLA